MSITNEQRIEIEKLLPFLMNGTLSDDERDLVAATLESDVELKKEVEFLESIQGVIRSQGIERPPGELGFARLRREIASHRRRATAPLLARLQYGLLAASAVLAMVGSITLFMSQDREPVFVQASGANHAAVLTVEFRAEATAEQISRLLLEDDLIIVDGPSALGLYKLSARDGEDSQAIAADLRTKVNIVEFVEETK